MDSNVDIEIDVDKIRFRNIYIPSTNFIIITGIILIFLILIFERFFIYIFLLIIPSYFLLIIIWIIIHLFILRWLVLTGAFPGRNKFVQFYLRNVQARIRANSLKDFLIDLNNKIDKLNNIPNSEQENNENHSSSEYSFSSINYPLSVYKKVIENYGKLSKYEENFYNELNELKNMLNNTSIAKYSRRLNKKDLNIFIPNEERQRYPLIQNQINQVLTLLKEFSAYKKYNYEEIKVHSNSYKLDCFLIKSDNKKKDELIENLKKNCVIICGPNLTPFENLIRSWDIENLYLVNNTDVFFGIIEVLNIVKEVQIYQM